MTFSMRKSTYCSVIIISIILLGIVLLTGCQQSQPASGNENVDRSSSAAAANVISNENSSNTTSEKSQNSNQNTQNSKFTEVNWHGSTIYLIDKDFSWDGEHSCDTIEAGMNSDFPSEEMSVVSYQDYKKKMESLENSYHTNLSCNKYTDSNSNYLVVIESLSFAAYADMEVHDVQYDNNAITLYAGTHSGGVVADGYVAVAVIPTDAPIGTNIIYNDVQTKAEFERNAYKAEHMIADKPIIYLYPETEQNVQVKLSHPELITCSYPKYDAQWNVIASPDGTLTDAITDKKLYALYYESQSLADFKMTDGFVVSSEDSASFLEEKLALLGLNEREAEEFIVYWLPKLESSPYNYIHFLTPDEIEEQMGVDISPKPDTFIRVWMVFEGLDESVEVSEQQLQTAPGRNGFTAVEWGGIKL